MSQLRVQLSLILSDVEVYNNLVLPAKSEKRLSNLLNKLLTAYYYNAEARALIDGVDYEADDSDFKSILSKTIADSQVTLQAFATAEELLRDTLDTDLSSIINKANDICKETGGTESRPTEFGIEPPRLGTSLPTASPQGISTNSDSNSASMDLKLVLDAIGKLSSDLSSMQSKVDVLWDSAQKPVVQPTVVKSDSTPRVVPAEISSESESPVLTSHEDGSSALDSLKNDMCFIF